MEIATVTVYCLLSAINQLRLLRQLRRFKSRRSVTLDCAEKMRRMSLQNDRKDIMECYGTQDVA